ncbi:MAG: hypothetical protein ACO3B4_03660 [Burkholderiaceae bacterium]
MYARVSTNQQTVQNQLSALREVAERSGYCRKHRFRPQSAMLRPCTAGYWRAP